MLFPQQTFLIHCHHSITRIEAAAGPLPIKVNPNKTAKQQ